MTSNKPLARMMLGAALAAMSIGAIAQDKSVELKFAHWLPGSHPLAKLGFEPWAKSVEAASNGSIKVALFPAQQLGKAADHYDMVRDGIADMSWVSPGYQAGRFPVFAAAELPFQISKPGPGSAAVDKWYRSYAATEMKDVRLCFAHVHIGTLHSKKPISEPGQIKGMKIRPANGTVAQTMTLLGATNVQVSAPESRDALEKGVADAITFPWNSLISFSIDKAVKNHTDMRLYAAAFTWVMNPAWYNKLSATQKMELFESYVGTRENRRHKPGRAFERTGYRFDVLGDYGAFRDLQRHRMLTIEWQRLTPDHGFVMPELVDAAGCGPMFTDAMDRSRELYEALRPEYPEQAAYAISMAYRLRYVMQFNAREAMHMLELRTAPQGHPSYRRVALEMYRQIGEVAGHRALAAAMTHITSEAPDLERLDSERRAEERRNKG